MVAMVSVLATLMLVPGCCHSVPTNVQVGQILPNPNDFVKSVVMVSVDGVASVEIAGVKKEQPTGVSASAVAIDKNHLISAAHFCIPVQQGQSDKGFKDGLVTIKFDKNMKMSYLNNNEEVVVVDNVKILAVDKEKDICLLEKKHHGLIPAAIAAPASIHRGDKVYIVGAPLGIFPVKTEGEVSIASMRFEEKEAAHINGRILVTTPATNGNSGGPAFSDKGEIIGIVMAGAETYDHMTILTSSRMILSFLKKNHKD